MLNRPRNELLTDKGIMDQVIEQIYPYHICISIIMIICFIKRLTNIINDILQLNLTDNNGTRLRLGRARDQLGSFSILLLTLLK